MSLEIALPSLQKGIEDALKVMREQSKKDDASSDAIIRQMASSVALTIQNYIESADIVTTDTIDLSVGTQNSLAPAPAFAGLGIYSSAGSGSGKGKVKFLSRLSLANSIEAAYKKARDSGKQDNANTSSIMFSLANDISTAIYNFALTGVVNTEITVQGGVLVQGYVSTFSGAAVPSVSLQGSGKGVGSLI